MLFTKNTFHLVLFQKLVCTTLRPTLLPYKELYDWDGASQFVSDYLSYVPLECPNELVSIIGIYFSCKLFPKVIIMIQIN